MAEIRLSKLTKQFNIGLSTLMEFLESKGVAVESNPNAKISDELVPAIEAKFGEEKKLKQDSEKVSIKLKEIIDGTKKRSGDEEDDREIFIGTTQIGKSAEAKSATAQESVPRPAAPAPKEEPAAPKPVAQKPVAQSEEPTPAPAPAPKPDVPKEEPVAKTEPAPAPVETAGPKVVGKIDLSEPKKGSSGGQPKQQNGQKSAPKEDKQGAKSDASNQKSKPVGGQEVAAKGGQKGDAGKGNVTGAKLAGPVVVDKIDLSQFNSGSSKKHGRKRIKKSTAKVDVTKVQTDGNAQAQNQKKDANKKKDSKEKDKKNKHGRNDKFKPAMTEAQLEEMQKEIQKQIKETYEKMNESQKKNFGAKHRREKREQVRERTQEEMEQMEAEKNILKVTEFVTVNDLATMMNNTPATKVIGACMELGLMVSINQRLDAETIVLVAEEFGYEVEFTTAELSVAIANEADDEKDLQPRPPVITVMGHVDHGKTSLLDHIRNTNVIAGEAGGITQHIGAYNVVLENGQRITFLDTPGHEAFTAMRARGAKMTDIAIIIIAADDAIMPQTVEAINHAQAAGVPMVFAINKIDKDGANPEKIREQLANMNILVEDWGGKYQCQEISAKKGINVEKLLDKVLLEAEMLDLKANPNRTATGAVIESSLDKGRGYLATVLVQNGTMRVGDLMLSGSYLGRIKAMYNERGTKVNEAGPATPVSVLGLNGAPTAGETFNIMTDERAAKEIASERERLLRIQGIKTQKHLTLEEIGRRIAVGNFKTLNIIVKGDVDGSVEALSDSLLKLSTDEVGVEVIHKAVGAISESDVLLAAASDAIIIGFQVRPSVGARKLADKEEIEIRLYSVIYDAINEVKSGIEGMLEPEEKEEVAGIAEVRETFKISKVGTIAGCMVVEGKIAKSAKVRVIRDGIVVYSGELGSLKRFKDDAKEVASGMECGLNVNGFNDIKVGDTIEAYNIVEVKRTL
ncbi:MAG: translation initiation factor IF-2 [Bacteroidales bacterium]|nr:translation initiation factor IF-2 [Bacteroidales bacterium]